jgi:putative flippase GtrA
MIIHKQFLMYVCVGVVCAVIDIASAKGLAYAGVHYAWAVSGGFFFSLIINYALHARVTFQAISSHLTMLRFGVVVAVNYLITMLFCAVSVHLAGDFIFGKLLSLPVIAINGFILSRNWVFR